MSVTMLSKNVSMNWNLTGVFGNAISAEIPMLARSAGLLVLSPLLLDRGAFLRDPLQFDGRRSAVGRERAFIRGFHPFPAAHPRVDHFDERGVTIRMPPALDSGM